MKPVKKLAGVLGLACLLTLAGGARAQPKAVGPRPGPSAPAKAASRVALQPGVWIDWERGVLEAAGSCAADLFAASADVARIKSERLARLRAEERLRKALASLVHDDKQRAHLTAHGGAEQVAKLDPATARVLSVDYASSGSVSLRLELPLAPSPAGASPAKPGEAPTGRAAAPDAGPGTPLPDAGPAAPNPR